MDSYEAFFEKFNIDESKFIAHGIDQIRTIEISIATKEWEKLKKNILTGEEEVHIRSYGVKGQNSHLFLNLYSEHFQKSKILIDKTNNQKAQKMIYNLLGHNKKYSKADEKTLFNFQTSHVFSKTKNPFCFLAPWNIVLLPKLYDPLTGHEAKGSLVEKFTSALQAAMRSKFENQIKDFNAIMDEHSEKIIKKFSEQNRTVEKYNDHLINLRKELAKIPI